MPTVLQYAAFTTHPDGGNPAGVVLDATDLSGPERQRIAAEVGHSETAFLTQTDAHRYAVEFYSPEAPVAFCGHATIATAVALFERSGRSEVEFDTQAGTIAVDIAADGPHARAGFWSVPTSSETAPPELVADVLDAMHWSPSDLDPGRPVHLAYAGNQHLVLPAADRATLARIDYDFDRLKHLMHAHHLTTVHVFSPRSANLFDARNLFPVGGVVEDPATGAAAAAFAGYLHAVGGGGTGEFVVVQGTDMGRESTLTVRLDTDTKRAHVAGNAVALDG